MSIHRFGIAMAALALAGPSAAAGGVFQDTLDMPAHTSVLALHFPSLQQGWTVAIAGARGVRIQLLQ